MYESVYWSGRILTPSASAIKEDVIGQFTRRGWEYTIFDRSAEVEMFHVVSEADQRIIVGGWIYMDRVLTLVWCDARPL